MELTLLRIEKKLDAVLKLLPLQLWERQSKKHKYTDIWAEEDKRDRELRAAILRTADIADGTTTYFSEELQDYCLSKRALMDFNDHIELELDCHCAKKYGGRRND